VRLSAPSVPSSDAAATAPANAAVATARATTARVTPRHTVFGRPSVPEAPFSACRPPLPESQKIAGLLCFYNEKVDLFVDGVLQERPITKFS
jgi:hypothetical protein